MQQMGGDDVDVLWCDRCGTIRTADFATSPDYHWRVPRRARHIVVRPEDAEPQTAAYSTCDPVLAETVLGHLLARNPEAAAQAIWASFSPIKQANRRVDPQSVCVSSAGDGDRVVEYNLVPIVQSPV